MSLRRRQIAFCVSDGEDLDFPSESSVLICSDGIESVFTKLRCGQKNARKQMCPAFYGGEMQYNEYIFHSLENLHECIPYI